jgi:uncharacterized protein (TIRG00374 family)
MRSWRALLGLVISAGFLYIAFRGQHFGDILDALQQANLWWLIPALLLYFGGVWVRAVRWRILLRPLAEVESRQLFPIVVIGYMANNVLPLRTGELVRSYVLRRQFGVRKTSALATIAVERLFDGLVMLAFMLSAIAFVSFTSQLRHLTIVAAVLFTGLLIGLFMLTLGGSLIDRLLQIVLGPLPTRVADRVERLAQSFLSGLGVFRRRGDLLAVAGTSVLAWTLEASMYLAIARGFGADVREQMGISVTLLTTGVANMATLIPSSPGYIGQFEYGVKLVLNGAMDVPESQALAYALLVHAALYIPVTLLGVVEWFRRHLSLGKIRDVEENGDAEPGGDADRVPGVVTVGKAD